MYNEYFGFIESPFSIAPDPRYLYMSEQHREALAHLVYGVNSEGGFVLLTGEVGTGKTTVCRCLLEQVPEHSSIAFILNPKLSVIELLATICDEFGIPYPEGAASSKIFVDLINAYLLDAHANGRKAILIIDEAQNLSSDVLEQLRLLTNLETNRNKLLQIILLGQPELKDKLSKPELRQLSQRIIARYHLGSLSKKDIRAYVSHRLAVAGLKKEIFPDSTINRLFVLTGGVPRLINVICDRALLGTYTQGKESVSKSLLNTAAREVYGESGPHSEQRPANASAWIASVLLLLLVGTLLAFSYYKSETPLAETVEVKESAHAAVPQISEDPKTDILEWPADQLIERSQEMAFQSLLSEWDLTYSYKDNKEACAYVQAQGLRCEYKRGNLRSMTVLNRPAILKLYDKQGRSFYGTLLSVLNDTASLAVGKEVLNVSVSDLESHWLGDYTMIWETPPNHQGDILPDTENPDVPWLAKQLALIQGTTVQPVESMLYNNELVNQVKEFQLSQGLVPDGIVGMQTFIRINTAVNENIPKLVKKHKEL